MRKPAPDATRHGSDIERQHFNDLQREFDSCLLEMPRMSDHEVCDQLGNANITTAGRCFSTTRVRLQQALHKLEKGLNIRTKFSQTDSVGVSTQPASEDTKALSR